MPEKRYRISFSGEIAQGHDQEAVKRNLARIFKLEGSKVEQLFSGKPVVLKQNADYDSVLRHKKAFQNAGAICRVEELKADSMPKYSAGLQKKEPARTKPVDMMTCPKCGHEQETADQCSKCGIFIEKYLKKESDALWQQEPATTARPGRKEGSSEQRPTSVTVICWLIIAGSIAGMISNITNPTTSLGDPDDPVLKEILTEIMSRSPIPISLLHVWTYVGLLVSVVSAIAMLNGRNWGRVLFVIKSIVSLLENGLTIPPMMKALTIPGGGGVAFFIMSATMILAGVFVIICAIFLFLPKANAYFSRTSGRKK